MSKTWGMITPEKEKKRDKKERKRIPSPASKNVRERKYASGCWKHPGTQISKKKFLKLVQRQGKGEKETREERKRKGRYVVTCGYRDREL